MRISVLVLFLLWSGFSIAEEPSRISIDIDGLNARITDAISHGAQWPSKPIQVTRELFGGTHRNFASMPEDELICSGHRNLIRVLIMRGSFSKEWGWGDWCEVHLRKVDDDTWRLCYVLPMNKDAARIRNAKTPLKVQKTVELVE